MINNKTEQMKFRDAQIDTKGGFEAQRKEVAGLDISEQTLHELTVPELVDKWNALEGEYILLKWKIALVISGKFNSKIEFGQFLQELRTAKPNHPLCTIKQSTFYRYARAAKFCSSFKIFNLKEIGISPTEIYNLSEIKNERVVDCKFIENIKKKNLPVDEIKRLIYQANSITGELIPEPKQSTNSAEMELPAQDFEHLEVINIGTQDLLDSTEEHGESAQLMSLNSQPLVSCIEPTNQLTEDQVGTVIKLLESFNLKSVKKGDDKKAYFKTTWIEYGDPAQVTVCIKSVW